LKRKWVLFILKRTKSPDVAINTYLKNANKNVMLYRVAHKYLNDFLKMGVASK
jgi:hypothetical protein